MERDQYAHDSVGFYNVSALERQDVLARPIEVEHGQIVFDAHELASKREENRERVAAFHEREMRQYRYRVARHEAVRGNTRRSAKSRAFRIR